ncbi:nup93/Nic96 domain-containing protein [Ditylenchus destructor]|uniref:Nuclear pore protein n=1 Tax=Ditylenchus destructor TaxID=166010 RepID=A0AAD4MQ13_9BILA|nr:nup93/Nic96 domain-containing protein [Ditylenchus destructor]
MASQFDDILRRAEQLHTDASMGSVAKLPASSRAMDVDGPAPLNGNAMMIDTGLADIFRQSEEMWKRKNLTKQPMGAASAISALKTSKDMSQLSITALSEPSPLQKEQKKDVTEYDETATVADSLGYDSFVNKEIERYVQSSYERARLEAERSFLNQQVLHSDGGRPAGTPGRRAQSRQALGGTDVFQHFNIDSTPTPSNMATNQPLEYQQNVFAQKIDLALRTNCQAVIKDALMEAVDEINDKDVNEIWDKVFVVCSKILLEEPENVRALRTSRKWAEHVVSKSTKYLHEHFKQHAEAVVENNLTIAKRGGIPGTLSLVDAYLNVKKFSHTGMEDGGLSGSHPTWMVLFYCLRLGDLKTAADVAKKLFNVTHCSTLVGIVANLVNTASVESDAKVKLSAEWRQGSAMCRDIYKKAIYGLLLGFDCPEVNTSIEDWLWARLMFCKLHPRELASSFKQLQSTVCVEFGEEYFVHKGTSCAIYFSALLLTGQLEQAIKVLFGENLIVQAVHIAILSYQLKLLILSDRVSSEILTSDVHDATLCELNLARIVLLYVKNFELTNVNFALNYCFFLNKFELDASIDNRGGRNLFESCVSRIVYLSNETDQILGRMNAQGERLPGLIDKFASAFNVSDIISYVAADTAASGDVLQCVNLYALANRPNNAIQTISRHMSSCIHKAAIDDSLKKYVELARWLADRYKSREDVEKTKLETLFVLINLDTFFRFFYEEKYDGAVRVIQKLNLIPLEPDEVQSAVQAFDMVPEEVRPVLPDLCTALMKSIVALYEKEGGSMEKIALKEYAKSIVLYTAMIPYRFPISSNSLLLQLQSKIV